MLEAIAYVLYLTAVFAVQFTAAVLAVLGAVLALLIRLVRALARATWELVQDARGWRRAPTEMAVQRYPAARRARPRPRVPPALPRVRS